MPSIVCFNYGNPHWIIFCIGLRIDYWDVIWFLKDTLMILYKDCIALLRISTILEDARHINPSDTCFHTFSVKFKLETNNSSIFSKQK